MFNVTKFYGPSESYSPLVLLKELDRLLLLAGWVREGLDPATLDSTYTPANLSSDERAGRRGPFGYRHKSGEVMWFYALLGWAKSGSNYICYLTLQWTLKPSWNPDIPPELTHLNASYSDTSHSNELAEWYVGAGDHGFYVLQTQNERPGGFLVERLPDGRWLLKIVEHQHRWGDRSGTNLYTIRGGWDGWHADGMAALLCGLSAQGRFTRHGEASIVQLGFYRDLTSGTLLTPDGTVQRGYWYHLNGAYPVQSDIVRSFYEPSAYASVEESGSVKTFQRLSSYNVFGSLSWRKS